LIGGENNGWKSPAPTMELEHGGDGRIAVDPLIERVVEYCRSTPIDGNRHRRSARARSDRRDDHRVKYLRRFNQLIYWRRFAKETASLRRPQQRYYQRMLRPAKRRALQAIMGADALEQKPVRARVIDFRIRCAHRPRPVARRRHAGH